MACRRLVGDEEHLAHAALALTGDITLIGVEYDARLGLSEALCLGKCITPFRKRLPVRLDPGLDRARADRIADVFFFAELVALRPRRARVRREEYAAPRCAAHPERRVAGLARDARPKATVVPFREREIRTHAHRKPREVNARQGECAVGYLVAVFIVFVPAVAELKREAKLSGLRVDVSLVPVGAELAVRTHMARPANVAKRLGKDTPLRVKLFDVTLAAPDKMCTAREVDFLTHGLSGKTIGDIHGIGDVRRPTDTTGVGELKSAINCLRRHSLRQNPARPVRDIKDARKKIVDLCRIGERHGRCASAREASRTVRHVKPQADRVRGLAGHRHGREPPSVRKDGKALRSDLGRIQLHLVRNGRVVGRIPLQGKRRDGGEQCDEHIFPLLLS